MLCIFPSFGFMVSIGTLQEYWETHQLAAYTARDVGWIAGVFVYLSLALGIFVGPLFDSYGHKWIMTIGSTTYVAMIFLLDAAVALNDCRQTTEAAGILRQYLAHGQQSDQAPTFRVHTLLGEMLAAAGDKAGARREFQAALALASPLLLGALHQGELGGAKAYPLDGEAFVDHVVQGFVRAYRAD